MALTPYETQLMAARLRQLVLIDNQATLMDKALKGAYADVTKALENLASGSTDTIKPARLAGLERELNAIMDNTMNTVNDYIQKDIYQAAQIATDGKIKAGTAMLYDISPTAAQAIPRAFTVIPQMAVQAVLARTYDDNKTFSDRIWDLRNHSKTVISDTVAKGVAQGKSARNIAKELEPYLTGVLEIQKGLSEEEQKGFEIIWKQMRRKRGDLRYNAMRLARTENNNAYREANILSAQQSKWVEGAKWNLSNSHPKPDICDVYASQDLYGLGRGVYPPNSTPRDHPNGLCFLTDKLVSQEKMLGMIQRGELDRIEYR